MGILCGFLEEGLKESWSSFSILGSQWILSGSKNQEIGIKKI